MPVAKITSMRSCGAMIIASSISSDIFVNNLPICTVGAIDSHGGVAVMGSFTVFANLAPVCRLGDVNDMCKWVYPPHFSMPLVLCDYNVFSA